MRAFCDWPLVAKDLHLPRVAKCLYTKYSFSADLLEAEIVPLSLHCTISVQYNVSRAIQHMHFKV